MEEAVRDFLQPLFYVQMAVGALFIAWWMMNKKDKTVKMFGLGMTGYGLGLAAWAVLVITDPENLEPLILTGAVPFLLAHFAFAKVAYKSIDFAKTSLLMLLVTAAIFTTFVVRTFFFESQPYYSSEGLLFFGLHSVAVACYIATIALTFLPAISVLASRFKQGLVKNTVQVGFSILFINSIVIVSGYENVLLTINSTVMSTTMTVVALTLLFGSSKALKKS
ncbi:MAG: hypothetical protein R3313_02165 [Candidatus Saccharimonadales bacterium]|nr:hypothetical protein [Candidatus Saccharimonadales bacterium]